MTKSQPRALLVIASLFVGSSAGAEPFPKRDSIEPRGMTDRATRPTKISWCAGSVTGEVWSAERIAQTIISGSAEGRSQIDELADAADHLCQGKNDPTWLEPAKDLLQAWMNFRGMSQADAEKDIPRTIAKLKQKRADADRPPTDDERFAFGEMNFTPVKPEPGVGVAQIGAKPAWCDKAQIAEKWQPDRIGRTLTANGLDGATDAALHVCQRPDDPTWRREAGYVLQQWMNWTHLAQADAEASLRARIQPKFKADKDALCKGLEISPEVGGKARTFAEANQRFFGCGTASPAWVEATRMDAAVGFYLDVAPHPDSEIMRMYWLFQFVPSPWGEHELPNKAADQNRPLLYYAIAQNDFAHLDTTALDKMLSAAPYNDYARTVVMESVGFLKAEQAAYEQALDKITRGDKDYQHILREVPKQAFADWDKAAARWKTELEHSNAFENKLSEPSRSVLRGCAPQLQKDAEKVLRSLKETTYQGLVSKIVGDPVASLLISRLAICEGADEIYGANALAELIEHGRALRGPRSATYYALIDAIAAAMKDRPRMLLQLENFWMVGPADSIPNAFAMFSSDLRFNGALPTNPEKDATRGVVKAVNKVPQGLEIVFQTVKITYPDYACVDDTSHPLSISSNGHIEYYRSCKSTGTMATQDNTPKPVVIAPGAAAGVKPGVAVVCGHTNAMVENFNQIGYVMYVKKTPKDTKILTFFGMTL